MFPLGQSTWYALAGTDPIAVDRILMDSAYVDGDRTVYYNKRRFRAELYGPAAELLNAAIWGYWEMWPMEPSLYMDSLEYRNDTAFFHSDYSTSPFFFLPKAAVGDSWTVTSDYPGNAFEDITITCMAIDQAVFLGITDSVKTFDLPEVGMQMRLSKTHGLVEFPALVSLLYHPPGQPFPGYEMIGLDRPGETAGYQQPGFLDYFPLQPGDVLLWQYDWQGMITDLPIHELYRDSITYTNANPDSVVYRFDRTKRHTDQSITFHPQATSTWLRSQWRPFLEASPNDWCLGPDDAVDAYSAWSTNWLQLKVDPSTEDTVTEVQPSYMAIDIGRSFRLDTRVGLLEQTYWYNPYEGSLRLIAYRVGGVTVGDLESLHLGLQENPRQGRGIYPNPVRDRLFIQAGLDTMLPFVITDAMGREVQRGQTDGTGIAVAQLPKGLYLLRMQMGGQLMTARFVKE